MPAKVLIVGGTGKTTVYAALPDNGPEFAVMLALPAATAVAMPLALTVAAAVLDEAQVMPLDRTEDVPSENVPVAINC